MNVTTGDTTRMNHRTQKEQTKVDLAKAIEIMEQRKYELTLSPVTFITMLTIWKLSTVIMAIKVVALTI